MSLSVGLLKVILEDRVSVRSTHYTHVKHWTLNRLELILNVFLLQNSKLPGPHLATLRYY